MEPPQRKRPPSPANVASQICLQPHIETDCGHSVMAFYIFYDFASWKFTVEFPTGLPVTCVLLQ